MVGVYPLTRLNPEPLGSRVILMLNPPEKTRLSHNFLNIRSTHWRKSAVFYSTDRFNVAAGAASFLK